MKLNRVINYMAQIFINKLSLSVLLFSLFSSFALAAEEVKAIAWDDLNKYEQLALKPLQENWSDLEPEQQKQFQNSAEHMLTRAIRREAFNRERMKRWSNFTDDRREHVRDRYQHYREIDPERRERMRAARERFESLSEEEKQEIQQRWESLPPDQRPRFGPPGHRPPPPMGRKEMEEQRKRFEELSEEEKQEWRERREERRERRDSLREEHSQENSESDSERN